MTFAIEIFSALYSITYPFRDFPSSSTMACASTCWADKPFALISETGALRDPDIPAGHPAIHFAQTMAQIHNAIIRALNSIYNQCTAVKSGSKDAVDFLKYCQFFHGALHHHHDVEEETFFPDIEKLAGKPGMMEANVEQHKEFEEGLENFRFYVCETSPENYDGQRLKDIIDSFGKILEKHLHDEIPTLLSLHHLDAKKMKQVWARAEKAAQANNDLFKDAPITFGCVDRTFKVDGLPANFPPVPFFIPYLVHYVFSGRHAGAWRFNPCTFFKAPRPLQLAS
jgi:hemerythrin-like domain-containing protein